MHMNKAHTPIDMALFSLEQSLAKTVAAYPYLKQHMNIRVTLELEEPTFNVRLDQQAAYDFKKRASMMNMSPEDLIKHLVLEYLYDEVG